MAFSLGDLLPGLATAEKELYLFFGSPGWKIPGVLL